MDQQRDINCDQRIGYFGKEPGFSHGQPQTGQAAQKRYTRKRPLSEIIPPPAPREVIVANRPTERIRVEDITALYQGSPAAPEAPVYGLSGVGDQLRYAGMKIVGLRHEKYTLFNR